MIVVLVAISALSGLILGPLRAFTEPKAELNILKFKKVPAVINILKGDPTKVGKEEKEKLETEILADKKELAIEGQEKPTVFFVLKKDGKPYGVAIESAGKGYAGDISVMVGFNLQTGNLEGIGIGAMSETPGVGTRTKEDSFTMQFRGMSKNTVFKIKKDGGGIDAVTGATFSSRGVALAVTKAKAFYDQHQQEIKKLAEGKP
jgi:electron transport complex protein RnfG